jgi:hypothetical protein
MAKAKFGVSFEIVTPESAAEGDADERGMIEENESLREAISDFNTTRTRHVGGVESIEADISPIGKTTRVCFITITNSTEFLTGAQESRTLHIPKTVTDASSRRIAKLVGVKV